MWHEPHITQLPRNAQDSAFRAVSLWPPVTFKQICVSGKRVREPPSTLPKTQH